MDGVKQDYAKISAIASDIIDEVGKFESDYTQFFSDLASKIGESGTIWSGNNAATFALNASSKEKEFANAAGSIRSYGTNLEQQAQAWASFERG